MMSLGDSSQISQQVAELETEPTEDSENVAPRREPVTSSPRPLPLASARPAPLSENGLHSTPAASSSPISKTKLKVTINNWSGVATW